MAMVPNVSDAERKYDLCPKGLHEFEIEVSDESDDGSQVTLIFKPIDPGIIGDVRQQFSTDPNDDFAWVLAELLTAIGLSTEGNYDFAELNGRHVIINIVHNQSKKDPTKTYANTRGFKSCDDTSSTPQPNPERF